MSIYALIKDGIVENTVVWDGAGDEELFADYLSVNIGDVTCGIGWGYADGEFTAPPEPQKTHDELVAEAESEKQALITSAQQSISLLQTKLLMGRTLTASEASKVNSTLDYIDTVEAIDTSTAPDIEWPVQPV